MLTLREIHKTYESAGSRVEALRGVSISFRRSEFVSVLGPSGCGKTTLLNLIGGLDRYTSGDMLIAQRSTKDYTDHDWDNYRNHSIGFVFQNYNLIPHQSVLKNVELALTLAGVTPREGRERATAALVSVGLGDQLNKRPNQLSGGQMQRVAIARALVNDPEILLADEPTGALDSETSVQIMSLLRDVSRDRLVIMVTHNPELARDYSTRIVRLLDGCVVDDTNPYDGTEDAAQNKTLTRQHARMSMRTALSLSLNNLLTKKARTILTCVAGSIGIIGIALILALSNGLQSYIDRVERDTLSSYPITIEGQTMDMTSLLSSFSGMHSHASDHPLDAVYSSDVMGEMMSSMTAQITQNNLARFKAYLDERGDKLKELTTDVKYGYHADMRIFLERDGAYTQSYPSTVMDAMGMSAYMDMYSSSVMTSSAAAASVEAFEELVGDTTLMASVYDLVYGRFPEAADEAVMIVGRNNEISDYTLYTLGLKDQSELSGMMQALMMGTGEPGKQTRYSFEDICALRFRVTPGALLYQEQNGVFQPIGDDPAKLSAALDTGVTLRVVGVVRPTDVAGSGRQSGSIGYTSALTQKVMDMTQSAPVLVAQRTNQGTDVLTGLPFAGAEHAEPTDAMGGMTPEMATLFSSLSPEQLQALQQQMASGTEGSMTPEMATLLSTLSPEQLQTLQKAFMSARPQTSDATYEGNLSLLGDVDAARPSNISLYPRDFECKEQLTALIDAYNQALVASGEEADAIKYTDFIGLLLSGVSSIINAISYILIAFVSISLVVSSIMIGIITYISVLERTKEIGILRSIGASKRDISHVFNAETLLIGLLSGLIGIGVTLLLCIPANAIIESLSGIAGVAVLPTSGAIILLLISMLLTFLSGLIPSGIAARKDPVVALRTE